MKQNEVNAADEAEVFESLTQNAFDFLKHSIKEFDKAPKYSVIHFCAAVEVLLKARLQKEHWSLVFSKPKQADFGKFKAGEFFSVQLGESINRINAAGGNISNDARECFLGLAKHRNKMIHFFHPGINNKESKEDIVIKHCHSWFYLHRLLTEEWGDYFYVFLSYIHITDGMMKKHRKYLHAKFKALKPELDAARKAGNIPRECKVCGFKAVIPKAIGNPIVSLRCRVCDYTETQFKFKCPHCGETIIIVNGRIYASCPRCEGAIEAEHLVAALTDWRARSGVDIEPKHLVAALTDHDAAYSDRLDGDDSWGAINCQCGGYHTVIRLITRDSDGLIKRDDGKYFCTSCLGLFYHIERCEWCGEYNTGDMGDSYVFGCGDHCNGQLGWEKDG